MNSFYEHHKDSIRWHYRCFDRILLNGLIQPFQQPERVVGFFNTYRQLYPVTRYTLRDIADQFQRWVTERAEKRNIPIVEAPKGRRDDFVDPYFERAKPDAIVVILKAREPARIMTAIGDKVANRWHLQFAQRWVIQYNFYINDRNWGRMFVRVCPYLPFSARICLNQHHWLANRMREEGIGFKQTANAFLKCAVPDRLQELANSQHRLSFSQVEHRGDRGTQFGRDARPRKQKPAGAGRPNRRPSWINRASRGHNQFQPVRSHGCRSPAGPGRWIATGNSPQPAVRGIHLWTAIAVRGSRLAPASILAMLPAEKTSR